MAMSSEQAAFFRAELARTPRAFEGLGVDEISRLGWLYYVAYDSSTTLWPWGLSNYLHAS